MHCCRIQDVKIDGSLHNHTAIFTYKFVVSCICTSKRLEVSYKVPLPAAAVPVRYEVKYDNTVHTNDFVPGEENWLDFDDAVSEGNFAVQLSYTRTDGTFVSMGNVPTDNNIQVSVRFVMKVPQMNSNTVVFVIPAVTGNTELSRIDYAMKFAVSNSSPIRNVYTDDLYDTITHSDNGTWYVASESRCMNRPLKIQVCLHAENAVYTLTDDKIPQNVVLFIECLRSDDQGVMSSIFREIYRFVSSLGNRSITVVKYGDMKDKYVSGGNKKFIEFMFSSYAWLRKPVSFKSCYKEYVKSNPNTNRLVIITASQITNEMVSISQEQTVFVNRLYRGDTKSKADECGFGYSESFSIANISQAMNPTPPEPIYKPLHGNGDPIVINSDNKSVCREHIVDWISHNERITEVRSPKTGLTMRSYCMN